ncbi:AAA family ATPase [Biostraticola tofi]|uniref:AAA domain-containing protein n=1 Tax=Biostraticola tofi TaxID=466109 RepID=A0A4R3YSR4_9GAMM|nr:AAA family ATPase [Biostraticola tofi]TCV95452.1 AAA domain-containing protein [Biostraticola tofi]
MAVETGKRVVLVNGIPASGKSRLAAALSERTTWPVLSLDSIKNPFLERIEGVDREFNRLLGKASYQAIWSIVADAPAGTTFIIDAWFGFQPKELLHHYLLQANVRHGAEIWCKISAATAANRYQARLDQRLPGHPGKEYIPELVALAARAEPMMLTPFLTVEHTTPLDMDSVYKWITEALEENLIF